MAPHESKFAIGDTVRIDEGDVTGVIDSIRFSALGPTVRVEWFNNGELRVGDFHEWRLSPLTSFAQFVARHIPPVSVDPESGGGSRDQDQVSGNMATFHSFKDSGKWYATGRARLDPVFFTTFPPSRRKFLLTLLPDGKYPGLNSAGEEFTWVIMPDENHENGFPIMLRPTTGSLA